MTSTYVTLVILCVVAVCSLMWLVGYVFALDKVYGSTLGFFLSRPMLRLLLVEPLELSDLVWQLRKQIPWLLLPMRGALCSSLLIFFKAELLTLTADGHLLKPGDLQFFTGDAKLARMKSVTVALTPAGHARMQRLLGQRNS